jgi:hypothetical protein
MEKAAKVWRLLLFPLPAPTAVVLAETTSEKFPPAIAASAAHPSPSFEEVH